MCLMWFDSLMLCPVIVANLLFYYGIVFRPIAADASNKPCRPIVPGYGPNGCRPMLPNSIPLNLSGIILTIPSWRIPPPMISRVSDDASIWDFVMFVAVLLSVTASFATQAFFDPSCHSIMETSLSQDKRLSNGFVLRGCSWV